MSRIILLDLNYTLVANRDDIKSLKDNLEAEEYRQWLLDLLKDEYVALVTARPIRYQHRTLANISKKTGWRPREVYFNFGFPPPKLKEMVLTERILKFGRFRAADCLAIESNPKTRAMYHKHGVHTIHVQKDIIWPELPEGILWEAEHDNR